MPAVKVNGEYGEFWYWESDSSRDVLSTSQQEANALFFYGQAVNEIGCTINAVAGMLGNIQHEGILNPAQWQYGLGVGNPDSGYGLCQWTPSTKYTNWCTSNGYNRLYMEPALRRIKWEADNGEQWYPTSAYPISLNEFFVSDREPSWLALAWLYNYERPKDPASTEKLRKDSADRWYTYLSGEEPPGPGPGPGPGEKRKRMPIWMYPGMR